MQKRFWYIVGCLILLIAGGGVWFFLTAGEKDKPVLEIGADSAVIGLRKSLTVTFSDAGRGLARTEVTIAQDNRSQGLSAVDYPETGIRRKAITVVIDAAALKLHDGPAQLTVAATDHSLWKNRTTVTQPVTIDTLPPQIIQLNAQNHINPGGACVVAYRLSEAAARTGVQAGELFYPAYPVTLAGTAGYAAYFALPLDAVAGTPQIRITAQDRAGNETAIGIPALIQKRKFRSDKMVLTESFLGQKMPEFQASVPELRGKTPIEAFVYVNTLLRADNLKTIQAACLKSEPRPLWQETFLRMKNAAPMALFGDRRTYFYDGKAVGESVHVGVDLASLVHAPIEAANNGIVRFSGPLGIYGNAVIIDHGMGLSTLYAHMSGIQVKPDQTVKRGEVIGLSGMTGLAGGDHLHFGVAIHGQFVDPREWWDPHWIADNVTKKLEAGS
ncbi:MAG: M23 family metallopeptidase [Deltaproteobacteria bacterium]|nr:M23 family metallopeptidase [Deltaproteobacteria bacterium]